MNTLHEQSTLQEVTAPGVTLILYIEAGRMTLGDKAVAERQQY
jgi:hypothetical protein